MYTITLTETKDDARIECLLFTCSYAREKHYCKNFLSKLN